MKRADGTRKMSIRQISKRGFKITLRAPVSTPACMPNAWRIKELAQLALAFRYQS